MARGLLIAALAVVAAFALPVQAATPAEFYHGRTVFVVIGYPPGGGYDLYARLLAKHLGKHIPGRPDVVPQNMPGAGSLKAADYLYSVAAPDGATIGTFAHGMGSAPLLGQAKFDARKFAWLGSVTKDVMVCLSWNSSAIKDWADVMAKPSIFGGVAAGNAQDIYAKLFKNAFGAKIRLATGFPGTADIALGMQRREVDGLCGIAWSTVKGQYADWVKTKRVNVLLQVAPKKDPDLPNVPLASDIAKTATQKSLLNFVLASQIMARPFAAPPGTPVDRKAALRRAFDETMKDPTFLADAAKLKLDVDPVTGADIDAIVASLYATPKDVIAEATKAIVN